MSQPGINYNWSYLTLGKNLPLTNTHSVSSNFTFKFYPKWYDSITLEWFVPDDWGNVTYNVFAGPTEVGPFTKLNMVPSSSNTLRDSKERAFGKYNNRYYVVEAIFPNGQLVRSTPVTYEHVHNTWLSLRKNEISRREWLLLSKFVGVKSFVFRKKKTGTRCPECWSEVLKRSTKDKCLTCYGTTWKDGYYYPIETYINYDTTPNDLIHTYHGTFEPNTIQAWTIDVPEILDLDIIIRIDDSRVYKVERVQPTELRTLIVRQILSLTELSRESVEHNLVDKVYTNPPIEPDIPPAYTPLPVTP